MKTEPLFRFRLNRTPYSPSGGTGTLTLALPTPPPFHLSQIGLGSATFGREIDQAASFAMMDHAIACGVNLFDTAATYSEGAAESIVGRWLATREPDAPKPVIATKLQPPYTPASIESSLAASVARLGLTTLDILYLHRWHPSAESPLVARALDRLVRDGRVRALGVCNFTHTQLHACLQLQTRLGLARFQLLQNNHNLAVREFDSPLRELCAAAGVTVITYSPLGAGFLTGKHRSGVVPGSRFTVIPGHQDVYFNADADRKLSRLAGVAARTGLSMPHLALAWALHQPGVTSVLIGGRETAHLDQAFTALALNDPALFAELTAA